MGMVTQTYNPRDWEEQMREVDCQESEASLSDVAIQGHWWPSRDV